MERERTKVEKVLSKIKFNKFELVFILEKKGKDKDEKITVQVENEANKEMFILDDKEIMVKL